MERCTNSMAFTAKHNICFVIHSDDFWGFSGRAVPKRTECCPAFGSPTALTATATPTPGRLSFCMVTESRAVMDGDNAAGLWLIGPWQPRRFLWSWIPIFPSQGTHGAAWPPVPKALHLAQPRPVSPRRWTPGVPTSLRCCRRATATVPALRVPSPPIRLLQGCVRRENVCARRYPSAGLIFYVVTRYASAGRGRTLRSLK